MEAFDADPICSTHGWVSHAFLHEAAHAVAGLDSEITFVCVSVVHPSTWTSDGDRTMVGGVQMGRPAVEWVPDDPRRTMQFVLAGSIAEQVILGHEIEMGWLGDLDVWRVGMGLADGNNRDAIEHALGAPLASVVADTERWVADRIPAIRAVAVALSGNDPEAADELFAFEWQPEMRLERDEVATIVAACSEPQ